MAQMTIAEAVQAITEVVRWGRSEPDPLPPEWDEALQVFANLDRRLRQIETVLGLGRVPGQHHG